MNEQIVVYIVYVVVSVALTIWVARTLYKNGRVFLIEAFKGSEERADAVNHLLVVGFYLVNLGFVFLFLKSGSRPLDAVDGIEYCATKLGFVMLILGAMHFFNIAVFERMRKGNSVAQQVKPLSMPNYPTKPLI